MAKGKSKSFAVLLIVIAVIAAAAAGGYLFKAVRDDINGTNQKNIEYNLVIEKQDFEYEIGQKLYNNKIVCFDVVWTNWMSKHYPDFKYINGEYKLTADMSYEEIAKKLQNPDISHQTVKVCIPEGYNCMDIAKTLEENGICNAEDFLEVCKSTADFDYDWLSTVPDSDLIAYKLEGFLFPATYDLAMNSDAKDVADTMLDTFDLHITKDMEEYCEKNKVTMFELVNLASVVQEEALGNNSAGNIASVFVNRLNKGAKLQSDVTYFYAAALRDKHGFSQKVYDAYYTYRCDGLPAGPISNSGDAIMAATVNHPDTDYLYFFSYNNGADFFFTDDYNAFQSQWQKLKDTNN